MSIYDYQGNSLNLNKNTHWTNVCHRGYTASGEVENTIPALLEAYNHGFMYCEGDVHITSDGYGVMNHDATITGTLNGVSTTYTIASTPLATIQALVMKESATYGTVHPPSWEEFLECASLHGMTLVLDLYGNSQTDTNIAYIVNKALAYGMSGHVLYTPNNATVAGKILALDRKARIRLYATSDYTAHTALLNGDNEVITIFTPGGTYTNASGVLAARQAGLSPYIWNISPSNYSTLYALYPTYAENASAYQGTDYGEQFIEDEGY